MFTVSDIDEALGRWDAFVAVQTAQDWEAKCEAATNLSTFLGLEETELDHVTSEIVERVPTERAPSAMFGVILALLMQDERDQRIIREHESETS